MSKCLVCRGTGESDSSQGYGMPYRSCSRCKGLGTVSGDDALEDDLKRARARKFKKKKKNN